MNRRYSIKRLIESSRRFAHCQWVSYIMLSDLRFFPLKCPGSSSPEDDGDSTHCSLTRSCQVG